MGDRRSPPGWREVRPGLVLLVAVVAVGGAIFFMEDIGRAFTDGPRLVLVAAAAPDLGPGSDVWVAGQPAGRVTSVHLRGPAESLETPVVIEAVIRRSAAPLIRSDASARIVPPGLLGPRVVSLRPGSAHAPPFDFADTLRTEAEEPRERVLAGLDTLAAIIERASPGARELTRQLKAGPGTLPSLRRNPELVSSLADDLGRLDDLLRAAQTRGSLGPLLRDTAWRTSLERSGARLREMGEPRTAPGAESPARASAEELAASLEDLLARLERLESDLREGRGTAGRALYDDAIQQQAELFRARLDSVTAELGAAPLRWLRLRLF